jgi:hypothetical protein
MEGFEMSDILQFPSKKPPMTTEEVDNKKKLKDWLAAYIHQGQNEGYSSDILSDRIIQCLLSEGWLNLR